MRTSWLLCLGLLGAAAAEEAAAPTACGPDVVLASEEKWNDVLASAPLVVVGFFAPWCGHCKKLKPHWSQLATQVKLDAETPDDAWAPTLEGVVVAEVDVVASPALYWEQDIESYPTVRLFRSGVPVADAPGRTSAELMGWLERQRAFVPGMPTLAGATVEEHQLAQAALVEQHQDAPAGLRAAVIGVFDPATHTAELEVFRSTALAMAAVNDDAVPAPPFATAEDVKTAEQVLGVQAPAVVVVRQFNTTVAVSPADVYQGVKSLERSAMSAAVRGLRTWIEDQRFPLTLEFTDAHKPLIFRRRPGFERHVLLFLPPDHDDGGALLAELAARAAALQNPARALFLWAQLDSPTALTLAEELGLPTADLPTVLAVSSNAKAGQIEFFRRESQSDLADGPLGPAQLAQFVDGLVHGRLTPDASPASSATPEAPIADDVDEADVVVLSSEDEFDALLNGHDLVMVEAYAPWCGHCKKLKPGYAAAATDLAQASPAAVPLAKFDATHPELKELAEKLGVTGFPTVLVAFQGHVWTYEGERSTDVIVATMRRHQRRAVAATAASSDLAATNADTAVLLARAAAWADAQAAEAGASDANPLLVLGLGTFADGDEDERRVLQQLAVQWDKNPLRVGAVATGALGPLLEAALVPSGLAEGLSDGPVLAVLQRDGGAWSAVGMSWPGLLGGGTWRGTNSALVFLTDVLRPALVELGDNPGFASLLDATHVMQLLLFDDLSPADQALAADSVLAQAVRPLAVQHARRVCFVGVDRQHAQAYEFFGLTPDDVPAARLVDVRTSRSYNISLPTTARVGDFRTAKPAAIDAVAAALELAFDADTGRNLLTPNVRSEPVEAAVLHVPLKKIVGHLWADTVIGTPQADVLVEYFDPGCPHCQKMQPVLESVAERLASRKAVFAQLDVTENDPISWPSPDGVPTLHLYPAMAPGEARSPESFVPYTGGPDRAELLKFLETHATHAADLRTEL